MKNCGMRNLFRKNERNINQEESKESKEEEGTRQKRYFSRKVERGREPQVR